MRQQQDFNLSSRYSGAICDYAFSFLPFKMKKKSVLSCESLHAGYIIAYLTSSEIVNADSPW